MLISDRQSHRPSGPRTANWRRTRKSGNTTRLRVSTCQERENAHTNDDGTQVGTLCESQMQE